MSISWFVLYTNSSLITRTDREGFYYSKPPGGETLGHGSVGDNQVDTQLKADRWLMGNHRANQSKYLGILFDSKLSFQCRCGL